MIANLVRTKLKTTTLRACTQQQWSLGLTDTVPHGLSLVILYSYIYIYLLDYYNYTTTTSTATKLFGQLFLVLCKQGRVVGKVSRRGSSSSSSSLYLKRRQSCYLQPFSSPSPFLWVVILHKRLTASGTASTKARAKRRETKRAGEREKLAVSAQKGEVEE